MKIWKIVVLMFVSISLLSIGMVAFFIKSSRTEEVIINQNNSVKKVALQVTEKNSNAVTLFAEEAEKKMAIVYDGLTMDELAAKLDRILNDDLSGKGYLYASHSLEMNVDPYLAVAISLLETGCKWTCSRLVKECNNVGGQKGSPSCNGGSYKSYETLDDGIRGFIDNIYYNYVAYDLLTPAQMSKKYAESTTWSGKVENYIEQIRKV